MVSFVCEGCQDTLKKPKLKAHAQWCHGPFTCIDCNTTFQGRAWEGHTSCISEEQKYQKGDLKGKGQKKGPLPQMGAPNTPLVPVESKPAEQAKAIKKDDQNAAEKEAKLATEAVNGEKDSVKKEKKDKKEKKEKREKKEKVKTEEEKKERKAKKEGKEKKDKKRKHSPDVDNALSHASTEAVTNGVTEVNGRKKNKKRKASPEVDNSLSHTASGEVEKIQSEKKKDKKRKVSEVESKDADAEPKPKKKKSKKDKESSGTYQSEDFSDTVMESNRTSPPPDPDLPMPDITTLLLPDIAPLPPTQPGIHPSRQQLFSTPGTSTLAAMDPSFRPRPQDIQRARRALERRLNPSKPTKAKLTLQEKQAKRKAKKLKRLEEPKRFVHKPVEITREPIEDPLKYFVEELITGEAQKIRDLVNKCKADVRSGGGVLNVSRGLFKRLGLRKEGVAEDGSGGFIFVDVLEKKTKAEDNGSDDDDDNGSD